MSQRGSGPQIFGSRVSTFGSRISNFGSRVLVSGFRVSDFGSRLQCPGLGFRISDFRGWGRTRRRGFHLSGVEPCLKRHFPRTRLTNVLGIGAIGLVDESTGSGESVAAVRAGGGVARLRSEACHAFSGLGSLVSAEVITDKNNPPLGPYRRPVPRVIGWS